VYHLASRSVGTEKLSGIPPVLDEAGIQNLPHAKVAVIDGVKLSPSQPRQESGQTPIAPVDLAQSAIDPGMAIFTKYEAVLNQDSSRMSVHDALILINRAISDYNSPESGSFDYDTQFCSSWFDQYGWSTGKFGEANVLALAKGTTVDGVKMADVIESGGGKVRLLKWSEYEADWDSTKDNHTPIWKACHQIIRRLNNQGESAAGELLAKMPEKGESIRQLAYHLYTLCERKKWAEEARAYNEFIRSWHAIVSASHEVGHSGEQVSLEL
jgi:putative DNA methylase